MARPAFNIEFRHIFFWGMFVGMFEGTISSIVAIKTFHASEWLVTFVVTTPMLANLLGGVWGSILTGRRKLRLLTLFAIASACVIASVAFTPMTQFGGYIFAAQMLLARGFLAGCVTARAAIWKHNYPTRMRGQIAARLQIVRFSMAIVIVLTVGTLFDWRPDLYVWVYPATALIGGISLLLIRPMRVRGERAEIAAIRASNAHETRVRRSPLLTPARQGLAVLRADRDFRNYCIGMMLLGFGNVMIMPLLPIIVTDEMQLSYKASCGLLDVLSRTLMILSMLPWAHHFDRRGVVRFRVTNAKAWTSAAAFAGVGAFLFHTTNATTTAGFAAVVIFIGLSRACDGLGRGGGAIAWNLGHLHFAKTERADVYMGTHVFLTGLRGLTAPFFGTWLYSMTGAFAFAVAVAFGTSGLLVFRRLAKTERKRESRGPESAPSALNGR